MSEYTQSDANLEAIDQAELDEMELDEIKRQLRDAVHLLHMLALECRAHGELEGTVQLRDAWAFLNIPAEARL